MGVVPETAERQMTPTCASPFKPCTEPVMYKVYAAYDEPDPFWRPHPAMRRYPQPMHFACPVHLNDILVVDASNNGWGDTQWVVVPIPAPDPSPGLLEWCNRHRRWYCPHDKQVVT